MKKTVAVLALIGVLITSVAFTYLAPPHFKNLKILPKNISEREMDSVMHHYSVSLGVKCDFCHAHDQLTDTWDMGSDAKVEKLVARKMMTMTTGINKKYFQEEGGDSTIQTITCYTCHKGEPIPSDAPGKTEEKK